MYSKSTIVKPDGPRAEMILSGPSRMPNLASFDCAEAANENESNSIVAKRLVLKRRILPTAETTENSQLSGVKLEEDDSLIDSREELQPPAPKMMKNLHEPVQIPTGKAAYVNTCIVCGLKGPRGDYVSFTQSERKTKIWINALELCDVERNLLELRFRRTRKVKRILCKSHFRKEDFRDYGGITNDAIPLPLYPVEEDVKPVVPHVTPASNESTKSTTETEAAPSIPLAVPVVSSFSCHTQTHITGKSKVLSAGKVSVYQVNKIKELLKSLEIPFVEYFEDSKKVCHLNPTSKKKKEPKSVPASEKKINRKNSSGKKSKHLSEEMGGISATELLAPLEAAIEIKKEAGEEVHDISSNSSDVPIPLFASAKTEESDPFDKVAELNSPSTESSGKVTPGYLKTPDQPDDVNFFFPPSPVLNFDDTFEDSNLANREIKVEGQEGDFRGAAISASSVLHFETVLSSAGSLENGPAQQPSSTFNVTECPVCRERHRLLFMYEHIQESHGWKYSDYNNWMINFKYFHSRNQSFMSSELCSGCESSFPNKVLCLVYHLRKCALFQLVKRRPVDFRNANGRRSAVSSAHDSKEEPQVIRTKRLKKTNELFV